MKVVVSAFASLLVFAGCIAAWWFYWPVWQVESQVKTRLPVPGAVRFSGVTVNRNTGTACGYVSAADRLEASGGRTHFILMPDGNLKMDPKDAIQGTTLQQLEILRKHADYLALVYDRCSRS